MIKAAIHKLSSSGVGEKIGYVTFEDTVNGLMCTPDIKGLEPGDRGFHIHDLGNIEPKDGKAGGSAGQHYDPLKTDMHLGPYGDGHMGDLPVLKVDSKGRAQVPVVAPRLKLEEIKGRAIIVHSGGDNYNDSPLVNGGGKSRIAGGVITNDCPYCRNSTMKKLGIVAGLAIVYALFSKQSKGSAAIYPETAGRMHHIILMFRDLIIKLSILYPNSQPELTKMVYQLRKVAEYIYTQLSHKDFTKGYSSIPKKALYTDITKQAFNVKKKEIEPYVHSRRLISLENSFVPLLKEIHDIRNRNIPPKAKDFLIQSFEYLLIIACKVLHQNGELSQFLSGIELRYPAYWSTEIPSYYFGFKDQLSKLRYKV